MGTGISLKIMHSLERKGFAILNQLKKCLIWSNGLLREDLRLFEIRKLDRMTELIAHGSLTLHRAMPGIERWSSSRFYDRIKREKGQKKLVNQQTALMLVLKEVLEERGKTSIALYQTIRKGLARVFEPAPDEWKKIRKRKPNFDSFSKGVQDAIVREFIARTLSGKIAGIIIGRMRKEIAQVKVELEGELWKKTPAGNEAEIKSLQSYISYCSWVISSLNNPRFSKTNRAFVFQKVKEWFGNGK